MITILSALLVTAQSSIPETLPFTWDRAKRVRVDVQETVLKAPLEYALELKVYGGGETDGIALERVEFEPISVAGEVVEGGERPKLYNEWFVRMEHLPNLRIDGEGAFKYFADIEGAEEEFFAAMTEGLGKREQQSARLRYGPGVDRELWQEPLREEWQNWSEKWSGLPLSPGSHSVKRRLYIGMPTREWLDVQALVTVSEPFEDQGRQCVRIESVVRLNEEFMGIDSIRYLRFISADPSVLANLMEFETFYRDTAVFDVETWLPVKIDASRKTRLGMETSRAVWVEESLAEHHYGFEWQLSDEG